MKKHLTALALVVTLVSAFTLPLFAQAASTGSMDVNFTLTEADVTPPTEPGGSDPDPDPDPLYIINIPASISLSKNYEENYIDITWENYGVISNQWVEVFIDGLQTFPDGMFYLRCGDGNAPSHRIACTIWRGIASYPFLSTLQGPDDALVARFMPDLLGGAAATHGRLSFVPTYSFDNVAGTYTGTVHFKIEFYSLVQTP